MNTNNTKQWAYNAIRECGPGETFIKTETPKHSEALRLMAWDYSDLYMKAKGLDKKDSDKRPVIALSASTKESGVIIRVLEHEWMDMFIRPRHDRSKVIDRIAKVSEELPTVYFDVADDHALVTFIKTHCSKTPGRYRVTKIETDGKFQVLVSFKNKQDETGMGALIKDAMQSMISGESKYIDIDERINYARQIISNNKHLGNFSLSATESEGKFLLMKLISSEILNEKLKHYPGISEFINRSLQSPGDSIEMSVDMHQKILQELNKIMESQTL